MQAADTHATSARATSPAQPLSAVTQSDAAWERHIDLHTDCCCCINAAASALSIDFETAWKVKLKPRQQEVRNCCYRNANLPKGVLNAMHDSA